VYVRVRAIEVLRRVWAAHPAESRPRSIDEHQVRGVEQAVVVVHQLVRRRWSLGVIRGDHAARAERAHVQPHTRRTGPAIVEESDRPLARFGAVLEIGHVEHRGLGLHTFGLCGARLPESTIRVRGVIPARAVHDDHAGHGMIVDRVAAHRDCALGGARVGMEIRVVRADPGPLGRRLGARHSAGAEGRERDGREQQDAALRGAAVQRVTHERPPRLSVWRMKATTLAGSFFRSATRT
jgi:hypothetical protein